MFKLDIEKAEEPEMKLPTSSGSSTKQESSWKNIFSFFFFFNTRPFDYVDHNKLWKILQEMGVPDHLTWIWMQVKKQQLELHMEKQIGSKLGQNYVNGVYCHPT